MTTDRSLYLICALFSVENSNFVYSILGPALILNGEFTVCLLILNAALPVGAHYAILTLLGSSGFVHN